MNRNEILNYLYEKRQLTAPVAVATNEVYNKQADLNTAKRKLKKTIIFIGLLTVVQLFSNSTGNPLVYLLDLVPIAALIIYKRKKWVEPAQEEFNKASQDLNDEKNNPNYINGVNGFPQKFYNYTDILRLFNLVNEGRADTLKEAYNLLETQQFQENQASVQEEIRSLQQDTANSAKWSAVSSTITAYNSVGIKRSLKNMENNY